MTDAQYNIDTIGVAFYSLETWQCLAAMPEARIEKSYQDFVRSFDAGTQLSRTFRPPPAGDEPPPQPLDRLGNSLQFIRRFPGQI